MITDLSTYVKSRVPQDQYTAHRVGGGRRGQGLTEILGGQNFNVKMFWKQSGCAV